MSRERLSSSTMSKPWWPLSWFARSSGALAARASRTNRSMESLMNGVSRPGRDEDRQPGRPFPEIHSGRQCLCACHEFGVGTRRKDRGLHVLLRCPVIVRRVQPMIEDDARETGCRGQLAVRPEDAPLRRGHHLARNWSAVHEEECGKTTLLGLRSRRQIDVHQELGPAVPPGNQLALENRARRVIEPIDEASAQVGFRQLSVPVCVGYGRLVDKCLKLGVERPSC
jgi:hypothetical protein